MSQPPCISVSLRLIILATLLTLVAMVASTSSTAEARLRTSQPAAVASNAGSADLAVSVATLSIAQVTGYQYFHATVTNNGPDPASNVIITGGTPPRSTFHCVTGLGAACGPVPSGVTCTAPTTAAPFNSRHGLAQCRRLNERVWMGFYHGLSLPASAYCDSASVTSSTPDPNTSNNTAGGLRTRRVTAAGLPRTDTPRSSHRLGRGKIRCRYNEHPRPAAR